MERRVGECPRCGKDLVIREGRYGQFVTCIGYPHCGWHRGMWAFQMFGTGEKRPIPRPLYGDSHWNDPGVDMWGN